MKPHNPTSSLLRWSLPLGLALAVAGCLSRPALVHQTYALQNLPATSAPTSKGAGVLAIRAVDVSPLFEGRSFVYRTGANAYEHDPYAGFLVSPDTALAIPLRAYLVNSGVFSDVIESGSLLPSDRVLEVHVSELYGDFRTPGKPVAALSARFVFFQTGGGAPSTVLLDKTYSRQVPLPQNTAAAVVSGWDTALSQIMADVVSDLAAAKQ